ncbi:MAG: 50S ribosomal protein L11 methyltransferase [Clostridiales bacterium]|nr:50S ribosomal protein L11 methyltransferase [Clostridiales bacterium]
MEFMEVRVQTGADGIDLLCNCLQEQGVTGFVVEDPADFAAFLAGTQTHWDYVEEGLMSLLQRPPAVTFYLADNPQGRAQLERVRRALDRLRSGDAEGLYGELTVTVGQVDEQDWESNWKQYFHTFDVGERLTVKPSWEPAEPRAGRVTLEIDPGSSFGTGTHHTTRLCLLLLEALPLAGERVLDMGCGSGILGIAAALLGAAQVTAVDIDENALRVAADNFDKNHIGRDRLRLFGGDVTGDAALEAEIGGGYDLVLANIVADVILGMRRHLHGFLRPGGLLIASGILAERAQEVAQGLEQAGLETLERRELEGWAALLCRRPAAD